jgi:hypothetical protein
VTYKIKLKNADDYVMLDGDVYEYLMEHSHYGKIKLLDNLRKHSSGCAVFQKTWKKTDNSYKTETVYLHKLVAEVFLADKRTAEHKLVGAKNGNKLDCRKENLIWRSRAWVSRQRKTTSKTGYMGVYKENKRYRAVISANGKSMHIGMFDSPEEAALAYNRKSWELFGHMGKQNKIKGESSISD